MNNFEVAHECTLFNGIFAAEFEAVLECLAAREVAYRDRACIWPAGGYVAGVGLVLSGGVQVIREDFGGNASIVAELHRAELFGEVFVCAGIECSPVTVRAVGDTAVLLLDYRRVVAAGPNACAFHARLVENMLRILAEKSLLLNRKIEVLSKRTTREKLLCFLEQQSGGAQSVTLPFGREQLAQHLCVERSAMCAELGRMRAAGLIRFCKNEFELLRGE